MFVRKHETAFAKNKTPESDKVVARITLKKTGKCLALSARKIKIWVKATKNRSEERLQTKVTGLEGREK
jgi:hypothetical protein